MNGAYTAYKRDTDGTQGDMITGILSMALTLSASKLSKFVVEGVTTGAVPVEEGDAVLIYRNGAKFLSGIVEELTVDCDEPATGVKYWSIAGQEDTVLFSRRQILGDPVDFTFDSKTYDQIEDSAYNRIIHYIRTSCGIDTVPERRFSESMRLPGQENRGTVAVSAYRSIALDKALSEIGKEDEFYPELQWDDKTGAMRVIIKAFRDKTDEIVISPEFGNVVSWTMKGNIPEFNAVWVVSGDYSKGRLYVYAEDEESVRKYGRIESIVNKSDITVWEEDPQADPEEETEEDPENPHLTEEDVYSILQAEARTQLKDHGRKRSYEIKAAETRGMAFMEDWIVGDRVTCVIDGDRFESQITEAKVSYKEGVETVEPTVGDVERGLFGKLFDMLDGLDDRITRKENE